MICIVPVQTPVKIYTNQNARMSEAGFGTRHFEIVRNNEIAFNMGWISRADLEKRAELFGKNDYGRYLLGLQ